MTVDGTEDYLVQGDKEQKIPPYGWLVHDGAGISIVPAIDFEDYDKVVKLTAPPQEPPQAAVDPLMPGDPVLDELKAIYEAGEKGGAEEVHKELKKAIGRRIHWCECPPGQCVGAKDLGADRFGCRQFSPLIK